MKKGLSLSEIWMLLPAGIGIIIVFVTFFSGFFKGTIFDVDIAPKYGDFIGGTVGTLFTLSSVLLFYLSLRTTRDSIFQQQFETNFLSLLSTYRSIKTNIETKGEKGDRAFSLIVNEFDQVYDVITKIAPNNEIAGTTLKERDLINISYICVFWGTFGDRSIPATRKILTKTYNSKLADTVTIKLIHDLDGHQSQIGHYYSFVYQIFEFLFRHSKDLDFQTLKNYSDLFRSMFSTYELILFFYNTLSFSYAKWNISGKGINLDGKLLDKLEFFNNLAEPEFLNNIKAEVYYKGIDRH